MKNSLLIRSLLRKVEVENKSAIDAALDSIQDIDLDDEVFEPLVSAITSLHTESSAKASKGVAEHHTKKYAQNITQSMVSKLQAMGFDELEVDEVIKVPFEQRWETALKLSENKLRKNAALSETERVKIEESKWKHEKDRADRLQASNIEAQERMRKEIETEMVTFEIRNLVAGLEIVEGMPRDKAIDWITNELQKKIDMSNATVKRSGKILRLVQADDPATDYYDAKNNVVSLERLIAEVGRDLNLVKKKETTPLLKKDTYKAKENPASVRRRGNSVEAYNAEVEKLFKL